MTLTMLFVVAAGFTVGGPASGASVGPVVLLSQNSGEVQVATSVADGRGGLLTAIETRAGRGGYSCDAPDRPTTRLTLSPLIPPAPGRALGAPLAAHLATGPVALPGGATAVLVSPPVAKTPECDPTVGLELIVLDAAGTVSERRPLAAAVHLAGASLVADDTGRPRAAWIEVDDGERESDRFTLRLAAPEAGGPTTTLDTRFGVFPQGPGITAVRLAPESRGRLLMAWSSAFRVRVAEVAAGGAVSRPQILGRAASRVDLAADTAPSGRAVVAWGSTDGGEERTVPYVVRGTLRRAGAARFARVTTLDPGGAVIEPSSPIFARVAPDGGVVAGWINQSKGRRTALTLRLVRTAPATTRFGKPHNVVRAKGVSDLRPTASGGAAVATVDAHMIRFTRVSGTGRITSQRVLRFARDRYPGEVTLLGDPARPAIIYGLTSPGVRYDVRAVAP